MKIVYWILGAVVALIATMFLAQYVASERVEVVELHTVDESGQPQVTRLWIVDDAGHQYLRVGSDGSGWFSRIQSNGEIGLTRDGETHRYTVQLRQDKMHDINRLMQEKYTWGDTLIGVLVGSREGSIPIELHPVDAG